MNALVGLLLVCAAACTAAIAAPSAAPSAPPAAPPASLPRDSVYQLTVPLTDQDGRTLTLGSRRGQPQLVTMFYSSCQFICPTIIDALLDIERKLPEAERRRLGITLISLDPRRDGPAALKTLAAQRGLDLSRWTLLQPRDDDLRAIAALLGVRWRALPDGEINHTGTLVLLDAEGRVLARTPHTGGAVDAAFAARVKTALQGH